MLICLGDLHLGRHLKITAINNNFFIQGHVTGYFFYFYPFTRFAPKNAYAYCLLLFRKRVLASSSLILLCNVSKWTETNRTTSNCFFFSCTRIISLQIFLFCSWKKISFQGFKLRLRKMKTITINSYIALTFSTTVIGK